MINKFLFACNRENTIFIIKMWMSKFIDFYDFPELIPVLQLYTQDNQNKMQSNIVNQLEYFLTQKSLYETLLVSHLILLSLQRIFSILNENF